jgi:hypothetical protein
MNRLAADDRDSADGEDEYEDHSDASGCSLGFVEHDGDVADVYDKTDDARCRRKT